MDHNNYMFKLNKILQQAHTTISPQELFRDVSDDFWFWMQTEGYRKSPELREILPGLPPEAKQREWTGASGDSTLGEAFLAYKLFKKIAQYNLGNGTGLKTVLDFGCGWGRILRFFLKDLDPSNLWGIDCMPAAIDICKQTNKWNNFALTDPLPPTSFANDTFDLIYCFSVFSHLAEEVHQEWLVEFSRILRSGGLLVATTWDRDFILKCAEQRKRPESEKASFENEMAEAFPDTARALSDYENGNYLFTPCGGTPALDNSFFGQACIPKGYVLNHWTKHFSFVDFIVDRNICTQNVIVVKKSHNNLSYQSKSRDIRD